MSCQINPHHIIKRKHDKTPIVMLTAYDYLTAELVTEAGIDFILVGDSLGNVFSGHTTTLPVTIEQIIYHTQAVKRGAPKSLVVADMPFLSYEVSIEAAKQNAGRLLKEGQAQAVKIETNASNINTIKDIIGMGIPVMGHLGFTPQRVYQQGGYKVQGREKEAEENILHLAKELERVGCFAVVLEMVPQQLAQKITESLSIPTIGIGAGVHCDGQVLVTQDLLGLTTKKPPKFVKQYDNLATASVNAISTFIDEVTTKKFPSNGHAFE